MLLEKIKNYARIKFYVNTNLSLALKTQLFMVLKIYFDQKFDDFVLILKIVLYKLNLSKALKK